MAKSKAQFLTKTTSFGGKKLVMYSIDGAVWSTRKDELAIIKDRLDNQRISLEVTPKEGDAKGTAVPAAKKDEKEEKVEEDLAEDLGEDLGLADADIVIDDVELPVKVAVTKGNAKSTKKTSKPTAKKAAPKTATKAKIAKRGRSSKVQNRRKAA